MITIVGMIYKSCEYLDFMMKGIRKSDVDYLIIANDATVEVLEKLKEDNINHLVYNDPKPDDYYLNRVYRAWNFAGMHAPGNIIIFINSDMAFAPMWIENLIKNLNTDTIPCSRLVESSKLLSGNYAISMNFGKCPKEFKEKEFLNYAENTKIDIIKPGGLYMPCAFYRQDFINSGGYPEGNVGKESGDHFFFYSNPVMKNKQHITVFDSIVYHIQEGEKDA